MLIAKLVDTLKSSKETTYRSCVWLTIDYDSQPQYTSAKEIIANLLFHLNIDDQALSRNENNTTNASLLVLTEYLRNTPTLIVLDGIDAIPSWEDQTAALIRSICDTRHQGCLILLSRSSSWFVHKLSTRNRPVNEHVLEGLDINDSIKLVEQSGIPNPTNLKWKDVVRSCLGNPYLILSALNNIRDWHNGSITSFYEFKTAFRNSTLDNIYTEYFSGTNRLSSTDKTILDALLAQTEPVSISSILHKINANGEIISYSDLMDSLEFLKGSSIVKTSELKESTKKTVQITNSFKDSIKKYYEISP